MGLSPEAVFDAFLLQIDAKKYQIYPTVLHHIFYKASLACPAEMASFEFLLRTQPYSPTLDQIIWEFQQADRLGRMNPDFTGYEVKCGGKRLISEDEEATNRVVQILISSLEETEKAGKTEMAAAG